MPNRLCNVTPPALIAAMPVGAATMQFFPDFQLDILEM